MKQWLKPQIEESQAGMEVTSYLPADPANLSAVQLSVKERSLPAQAV
jgi:coenzyme PQQ precursor peptide PqqA